jgi:hypothetical protein
MTIYNYYACLQNSKNKKWHCNEYTSFDDAYNAIKPYSKIYNNKIITTNNYHCIFMRDYKLLQNLKSIPKFDNFSFVKN